MYTFLSVLRNGIAWPEVINIFSFNRYSQVVFHTVYHLHYHQQCMRISMVHSLPKFNMFMLHLFNFSHSGCHISYGFTFLWWLLKLWTSFRKSVVHLSVLSYMSSPFPHFSVGLAVCLCLWLVRVCCIIWVLVICQIQAFVYCKYLPLCVPLFSVYNLCLLQGHIDVLLCFSSSIIFLYHAKT